MAPVQSNIGRTNTAVSLTSLWAANECFAGAVLHALNLPFKGIYLTGFSIYILTLFKFFEFPRKDVIIAGFRVSAIKAIVNPFASINSHLAVNFQSFAAVLILYLKIPFAVRVFIFSELTLIFSAMQRLFLLWLFYGFLLYDSVNLFIQKLVGEFTSSPEAVKNDYVYYLLWFYIAVHILAGLLISWLVVKFCSYHNEHAKFVEIKIKFEEFTRNHPHSNMPSGKSKLQRYSPVLIIVFLSVFTYLYSTENIGYLFLSILLRYSLAILLLKIIKLLYFYILKEKGENFNSGFNMEEFYKMKNYFFFAYQEAKLYKISQRPSRMLFILTSLAMFSSEEI